MTRSFCSRTVCFFFVQVFRWAIHFTPRPRNFLQRITPSPGNCGNVTSQPGRKCNEGPAATERSGYLSPAKWKSLKLEFRRAVLERGPRATLPQLLNAEGKPQMFANITIGGKCKQCQMNTWFRRLEIKPLLGSKTSNSNKWCTKNYIFLKILFFVHHKDQRI